MKTLLIISALCLVGCFGDEDIPIVLAKLNNEMKLECETDVATWKFKKNESFPEFMDIDSDNFELEKGSLMIKLMGEESVGVYGCFNAENSLVQQYRLEVSFRLKKMPASISVDLGGNPAKMHCTVVGDDEVAVRWFHRPEDSDKDAELTAICGVENDQCQSLNAEDSEDLLNIPQVEEVKEREEKSTTARPFSERLSIQLETGEGSVTSTLNIENAQTEDRAVYVCRAFAIEKAVIGNGCGEEDAYCVEESTVLRVKDPYAAIWPFIGIVLEVVVLCLVIFFCERRKKEDKEDSDGDRYAGNNVSSNNSLRQRK